VHFQSQWEVDKHVVNVKLKIMSIKNKWKYWTIPWTLPEDYGDKYSNLLRILKLRTPVEFFISFKANHTQIHFLLPLKLFVKIAYKASSIAEI
jgi:hypothetical protein